MAGNLRQIGFGEQSESNNEVYRYAGVTEQACRHGQGNTSSPLAEWPGLSGYGHSGRHRGFYVNEVAC